MSLRLGLGVLIRKLSKIRKSETLLAEAKFLMYNYSHQRY